MTRIAGLLKKAAANDEAGRRVARSRRVHYNEGTWPNGI